MVFRRATSVDLEALNALQHAAYARNRTLLGVEPIPLQADYGQVLADMQIWLADEAGKLMGALIVEAHDDHLLIWSIATDPASPRSGLGRAMLQHAEDIAAGLGLGVIKLYTGSKLTHLVAWYGRHGYVVDTVEERPDRSITHMSKSLAA